MGPGSRAGAGEAAPEDRQRGDVLGRAEVGNTGLHCALCSRKPGEAPSLRILGNGLQSRAPLPRT